MTAALEWIEFADAGALATALAQRTARTLRDALSQRGRALLVVAGGNTPQRFFAALSQQELDWSRVDITLTDERWVDETHPRSNARSVRAGLLQGAARAASFMPLFDAAFAMPEAAIPSLEARWQALAQPPAALILGMGDDGHFASLFPDGDNLVAALDPQRHGALTAMRAPAAAEPRVSLTLATILRARDLVLHIQGATKSAVIGRARLDRNLPIHALLAARGASLPCYWCP